MYSLEFRLAAIKLYQHFDSMRKVASVLNISIASISRWYRLFPFHNRNDKPNESKPRKMSEAIKLLIEGLLQRDPLSTCRGIASNIEEILKIKVSRQLVHAVIHKVLKYSYKRCKKRTVSKNKKESDVQSFLNKVKSVVGLCVSIDESGFDARLKTVYGYGRSGEAVVLNAPSSRDRKRHSLILSIASNGSKHSLICSGSVSADVFCEYITSLPFPKGSTLIMDNCSIHKTKRVTEAIVAKGYNVLLTPPYSPECNPIELAFAKIKNAYYRERYSKAFCDIRSSIETQVARLDVSNIIAFFSTIQTLKHYIKKSNYILTSEKKDQ